MLSDLYHHMHRLLKRYSDIIRFNRNLVAAGSGGFLASSYISDLHLSYYGDKLSNSMLAVAMEYAVYIPLFAVLFYIDNRHRYIGSDGKRNGRAIKDDVKKLLASFSVAEVVFALTRFLSQYQLLNVGMQAYQASMMSSVIAWIVFFISINMMVRVVRLFR